MKAVIFDCDGTLVDSEPLAAEAWRRAVAPYGYAVTAADLERSVGLPYATVHEYFSGRVELPAAPEFWTSLRDELFALIDADLRPFDDAVSAARALRAQGLALAVASSSPRERLDRTLGRVGLHDLFHATVAGDEVARGKPAPDMFLATAERLGVAPSECVVIEDSPPGVAAGRAAGMDTVAISRVPGGEASLRAAHRVVHELTPSVILGRA